MTESTPRYHALDSLRAAAMLLGVFFHASLAYVDPPQTYWVVQDERRQLAFGVFAWASHSFRMQVFFVMAGFFARLLYERYGPRRFASHRAVRILLPFAVGVLLDNAIQLAAFHHAYVTGLFVPHAADMAAIAALPPDGATYLQHFRLGIYWFLEYLLVFSIGVLLIGPITRWASAGRFRARIERGFESLIDSPWRAFALAVPHAVLLRLLGAWGVGSPQRVLPEPLWVLYYGIFFVVGWAFHRQPRALNDLQLCFRRDLLTAIPVGALALGGGVAGVLGSLADVPGARTLVLWLTASFTWLMVFGLMGAFERIFGLERRIIRYVSDSSYWLYLTHDYYVMALQIALASVAIGALFKYGIVVSVTISCLLVTYEFGVRYTWIGAILNGRKTRAQDGHALRARDVEPRPASVDATSDTGELAR